MLSKRKQRYYDEEGDECDRDEEDDNFTEEMENELLYRHKKRGTLLSFFEKAADPMNHASYNPSCLNIKFEDKDLYCNNYLRL